MKESAKGPFFENINFRRVVHFWLCLLETQVAGNGLKWNGIITVLGIWGVLELKTGGLAIWGFQFGSGKTRSPGLVFLFLV